MTRDSGVTETTRRQFLKGTLLIGGSLALELVFLPKSCVAASIGSHPSSSFPGSTEGDKTHQLKVKAPLIAEDGGYVPVTVALDHPMTSEHFIEWIEIYDKKSLIKQKIKMHLSLKNGEPYLSTRIRLKESTTFLVRAKCNRHGILEAGQKIKVTVGGC